MRYLEDIFRPSWPERMALLAAHWGQYSTCLRRKVGAVLYHPETFQILGVGYNDTPIGAINCGSGGCGVCYNKDLPAKENLDCNCVHAEMNALLFCARYGVRTEGSCIAIWTNLEHNPDICSFCLKHLRQAGIIIC